MAMRWLIALAYVYVGLNCGFIYDASWMRTHGGAHRDWLSVVCLAAIWPVVLPMQSYTTFQPNEGFAP